ncbi:MAG: hybrid sensor histidine kinase/response regulator [Aeromicrobium sp.]|nr:hybrid sensor histidine kinase/response regulator [Aeromicrobium sp.]
MRRTPPTIVLIDDSPEVRELIAIQFRLSGLLSVVGDGGDGVEAIGLAHQHQPDLVLLDMSMPTMDGIDALPGILTVSPNTRVVVFTGFEEAGLAARARQLGAAGLLEKSVPVTQLAERLLTILTDADAAAGADTQDEDDVDQRSQPTLEVVPVAEASTRSILDEHLERFREVFEQAAIGMATITLTGGIVRANRALGDILLVDHEHLVGTDYGALTDARGDLVDEALEEITRGAVDVVHLEHDIKGAPHPRRARATLAAIRDSEGQALYVFLQVQDITAQRAAEDQLRLSEQRFRLLVDAVEEYAIFMLSPEGIIVSWNSGAQRSKGYRADEIIGRHFRTFYPQEQQDSGHPEYELTRAISDGRYSEEGWRVRKDGSVFWANVVITAVFDETGHHVGFAKVTRDITANREAEEALRQSEERFRLLVEAVGDYAIFMLDPSGRIVSWNTGAERNMGYSSGEVIGQHFGLFYLPDIRASGHPERELELALRDGRYQEEGWRLRKDGTRYWANVVITAVFNDAAQHIGFAKVTQDRTDQRRAQHESEQAASDLADANSTLAEVNTQLTRAAADQSQFLAVTAHELRTPAAVLSGTADTLARHWNQLAESERQGLLDGMTTSADRLHRLLSGLLTASKLDANALHLRPVPVSALALLRQAADRARVAHDKADVTVDASFDVQIRADPDRFAQAIDNLVDNALAHGEGPVEVSVAVAGRMAELRVTDAGGGVNPAVLSRLFERFATGDAVNGTGLGLFIVRELARASGGDAYYEPATADRPGSTFVLTAPLA